MDDSAIEKRSNKLKSRQSIAHIPSARDAAYKDNATTDVSALQAQHANQQLATKKKSRGKSLGPGGIEALKESSANATKVRIPHFAHPRCCVASLTWFSRQHLFRSNQFLNQRFL